MREEEARTVTEVAKQGRSQLGQRHNRAVCIKTRVKKLLGGITAQLQHHNRALS